ncbi:FAD-dependent oxidoreductase [Henriciella aquimarina]|uniref:FAD-dependent oxidoreductase n=1 Tax=Henriciella aquimarina TaxID=545261 RepID=UPI000A012163|nr:GMC family oxidoreductase [Henriciella aquimarina]
MHFDFNLSTMDSHLTDICIIGAGVAAITMARRFLREGRTVTVLESGGLDYESGPASLNAGQNVGEEYYALDHARLRFFGGSTAIWGGRVAELDPIDLKHRDWVPHSGWPIDYAQLRHYYDQARPEFGLPLTAPQARDMKRAGIAIPDFEDDELAVRTWQFDRQFNRFTFPSCEDLVDHPRCSIITHATVTAIEAEDNGRSIKWATVRSLHGKCATIRARTFVLAAGGIENPRLLLVSNTVQTKGLGNDRDLVGRFFMEHPHARGGRVTSGKLWRLLNAFGRRHQIDGQTVAALIAAGTGLQQRERTLNSALTIAGRRPEDGTRFMGMRAYMRLKHDLSPTRRSRMLWRVAKKTASRVQKLVDPTRPWLLTRLGRLEAALVIRAEQAPNPDSRVMLANERDTLGVRRVQLDWQMSDLDIHSVDRLVHALGRELERIGAGRVDAAPWLNRAERRWHTDPQISAHPIGGYHHMGTTRMADDPSRGVVDRNGRVFGLANLYVAGSSIFPTSGWANPTLTIAALSLRTADHILRSTQPKRAADRPTGEPKAETGKPVLIP